MMVQHARNSELRRIEEVLSSSGLPSDDIPEIGVDAFLVCRQAGEVIGVVATELFPPALFAPVGLLRSLAVVSNWRNCGVGTQLVEGAEAMARESGVRELYLLTTSASSFFARLGYYETGRKTVPKEIGGTREFRELCPDSAVCMVKRSVEEHSGTERIGAVG